MLNKNLKKRERKSMVSAFFIHTYIYYTKDNSY